MSEIDRTYLESLVRNRVEEGPTLEYKASGVLKRDESGRLALTKPISALANTAGGRIILGIREFHDRERQHLPETLDPIDQSAFPSEWIDQITSLVRPPVDGLSIHAVHVGPGQDDYCFVIDIPKSGTIHQATDHRYYKRRNFESLPMDDCEIRDVMLRGQHARITAQIRVFDNSPDRQSYISVRLINPSPVMARHFMISVRFPLSLSRGRIKPEDGVLGENDEGKSEWLFNYSNSAGAPLFPDCRMSHKFKFDFLGPDEEPLGVSRNDIRLSLYADNSPKVVLTKSLEEAEKGWV